jgi:hypothetical protein
MSKEIKHEMLPLTVSVENDQIAVYQNGMKVILSIDQITSFIEILIKTKDSIESKSSTKTNNSDNTNNSPQKIDPTSAY